MVCPVHVSIAAGFECKHAPIIRENEKNRLMLSTISCVDVESENIYQHTVFMPSYYTVILRSVICLHLLLN